MKYTRLIILTAFVLLACKATAANTPLYKEVKIPVDMSQAYYSIYSTSTYVWTCVGATITYTISEGSSETTTKGIEGTFGSSNEAKIAFSNQNGIDVSRIQSAELKFDWVLKTTTPPKRTGYTSGEAYGVYTPTSPWRFSSWIIGPPGPTCEVSTGPPSVETSEIPGVPPNIPKQKVVTTTIGFNWTLRWMEVKDQ